MTDARRTVLALALFLAWLLAMAAASTVRPPVPPLAILARPTPHTLTCTCSETP